MSRGQRGPTYHDWVNEEGLMKIEAWARDGLINDQIAHNIGINVSTLYDWQSKFPEVREALKRGKEVVDIQVENALLKKALGYNYREEVSTKEGIKKLERFQHGDTTAQIFWLKNRKPAEWRDKQDIEHTGNMGVKIYDDIPDDLDD